MSEVKQIPLSKLEVNNGQIAGLPKNPRFIKDYKFQKLKKSLPLLRFYFLPLQLFLRII